MTITPAKLLRGLALLCILVAWGFLAHHGSTAESHPDFSAALATAPIAAIVVMLLWRVANPLWMVLGSLAVLGHSCGKMSRCFITSSTSGPIWHWAHCSDAP